jgi:DNA-binding NarL/FixJ family response regulator
MTSEIQVLIADDSPDIRAMLSLHLKFDSRFSVVGQAEDGEEAVKLVGELSPDLLLLDLGMPGLDGLEVLSRTRSGNPGMKIAILSGFPAEQLEAHALSLGADVYLEKTNSLKTLCDQLYALAAS